MAVGLAIGVAIPLLLCCLPLLCLVLCCFVRPDLPRRTKAAADAWREHRRADATRMEERRRRWTTATASAVSDYAGRLHGHLVLSAAGGQRLLFGARARNASRGSDPHRDGSTPPPLMPPALTTAPALGLPASPTVPPLPGVIKGVPFDAAPAQPALRRPSFSFWTALITTARSTSSAADSRSSTRSAAPPSSSSSAPFAREVLEALAGFWERLPSAPPSSARREAREEPLGAAGAHHAAAWSAAQGTPAQQGRHREAQAMPAAIALPRPARQAGNETERAERREQRSETTQPPSSRRGRLVLSSNDNNSYRCAAPASHQLQRVPPFAPSGGTPFVAPPVGAVGRLAPVVEEPVEVLQQEDVTEDSRHRQHHEPSLEGAPPPEAHRSDDRDELWV